VAANLCFALAGNWELILIELINFEIFFKSECKFLFNLNFCWWETDGFFIIMVCCL